MYPVAFEVWKKETIKAMSQAKHSPVPSQTHLVCETCGFRQKRGTGFCRQVKRGTAGQCGGKLVAT